MRFSYGESCSVSVSLKKSFCARNSAMTVRWNYNNSACSYPRDWSLSASWGPIVGLRETPKTSQPMVSRCLRGPLNWATFRCKFFPLRRWGYAGCRTENYFIWQGLENLGIVGASVEPSVQWRPPLVQRCSRGFRGHLQLGLHNAERRKPFWSFNFVALKFRSALSGNFGVIRKILAYKLHF